MIVCGRNVCFCSRHGGHRKLHSFPTRRSSDLARGARRADRWGGRGHHRARPRVQAIEKRRRVGHVGEKRSEEHTSELQSQSNLVCRLLLEKKKRTATVNTQSTPAPACYTQTRR